MTATFSGHRSTALAALLVLAVLGAPTIAATEHATVQVGDGTVASGEPTTVAVTLSTVPNGISGFNVTVELADPAGATITDGRVDRGFGLREAAVSDDGSSIRLKGVDTGQQYQPGDGPVRLGNVTVRADATARLTLAVGQVDDNDGGRIDPATSAGRIAVGESTESATERLSSSDDSGKITVTDSDTGTVNSPSDGATTTAPANGADEADDTLAGGGADAPEQTDANSGLGLLVIGVGGLVLLIGAVVIDRSVE
jgi:hypothetical protein